MTPAPSNLTVTSFQTVEGSRAFGFQCLIANSLFELGLDFYLHVGQFLADLSPYEQVDNI